MVNGRHCGLKFLNSYYNSFLFSDPKPAKFQDENGNAQYGTDGVEVKDALQVIEGELGHLVGAV